MTDVAMVVPDGVGVRNFVLGPFASTAAAAGRLHVLHAVHPDLLPVVRHGLGPEVRWTPMAESGQGRVVTTLRNSLGYAHMYWAGTEAMRRRLRRPVQGTTLGRRAMMRTAQWVGRGAASTLGLAALDGLHRRVALRDPAVRHYQDLFRSERPDVLFCTHQRPPEIIAPTLAAQSLGIPTATFIFSWDNLTSKGRIAAPFDHYLVWSDLMAAELLRYYPEVRRSQVHVVGTPQFDPYGDPTLRWSRPEFFARLGADPGRRLICYSGGDVATCPEDAGHVRLLLEMVREGRVPGHPQVLLRPSPVDDGSRYAEVREDYPELIYAPPAWVHPSGSPWSRVVPHPDDLAMLANITLHSDVNVNTASTMTLDFAVHDRPVVNVAFDLASPPPLGTPLRDVYYRFEHYRPVSELGAARLAFSAEELAAHLAAYLADPALDHGGRRRLVELEVGRPIGTSSRCVLAALEQIADAGAELTAMTVL